MGSEQIMTTENRGHVRGEVRAVADDGTIELLAVSYGITDDYGTQFQRGTFTESLEQRLPVIAFGHDWSDPIGRATAFREDDDGLYLTARLDIGGAVPRADQAYQQMRSGTLTDVSVGFWRTAQEDKGDYVLITKGELDEVSVVLRGAVPGARVLAVRSARTGEQVDLDAVVAIAAKKAAGEIDQATADEALAMLSAPPDTDPADADVDLPEDDGDADLPEDDGDADLPDEAAADVIAEAEDILNRSR
jgi:HK97 family phage prohead protease